MDIQKLIDDLRVCPDDDIICSACERYGKECDGSSVGPYGLMMRAAVQRWTETWKTTDRQR